MGREPIGGRHAESGTRPTRQPVGISSMSLFRAARSRGVVVLAAAAVLAVGAGSGAVAGAMITGKDIKDHSIKAKDLDADSVTTNKVKNKTLKLKDLSSEVTAKLGVQGPAGPAGAQGPAGCRRHCELRRSQLEHHRPQRERWRRLPTCARPDRNVRHLAKPPMGIGSLGVRTGSATDKAAFGNEVDFAGQALASITSRASGSTRPTRTDGHGVAGTCASVAFEIDRTNGERLQHARTTSAPRSRLDSLDQRRLTPASSGTSPGPLAMPPAATRRGTYVHPRRGQGQARPSSHPPHSRDLQGR